MSRTMYNIVTGAVELPSVAIQQLAHDEATKCLKFISL